MQGLGVAVAVSTGVAVGDGSSVKVKVGIGVSVDVLVGGATVCVSGIDVFRTVVLWVALSLSVGADVPQAFIKTATSMAYITVLLFIQMKLPLGKFDFLKIGNPLPLLTEAAFSKSTNLPISTYG